MFRILILLLSFNELKNLFESETKINFTLLISIILTKRYEGLRRIISVRTMNVQTCVQRASTVMELLSLQYQNSALKKVIKRFQHRQLNESCTQILISNFIIFSIWGLKK